MLNRARARLGVAFQSIGKGAPEGSRLAIILAAMGCVAYGAWQIYPPAGFMVGGGLLLAGMILGR